MPPLEGEEDDEDDPEEGGEQPEDEEVEEAEVFQRSIVVIIFKVLTHVLWIYLLHRKKCPRKDLLPVPDAGCERTKEDMRRH